MWIARLQLNIVKYYNNGTILTSVLQYTTVITQNQHVIKVLQQINEYNVQESDWFLIVYKVWKQKAPSWSTITPRESPFDGAIG